MKKNIGKVYLQFPNFMSDEVFGWFVNYVKQRSRQHIARVRGYTVPEVDKMMNGIGFKDLEIRVEGEDIIAIGTKHGEEYIRT
jgi:hypothetical protein